MKVMFHILQVGLRLDQIELAKDRFEKSLDYNNYYPLACYNLGYLYEKMGDDILSEQFKEKFNQIWKGDKLH